MTANGQRTQNTSFYWHNITCYHTNDYLFCRISTNSGCMVLRSTDISSGYRRDEDIVNVTPMYDATRGYYSNTYRCKHGPNSKLCLCLVQGQTTVTHYDLWGGEATYHNRTATLVHTSSSAESSFQYTKVTRQCVWNISSVYWIQPFTWHTHKSKAMHMQYLWTAHSLTMSGSFQFPGPANGWKSSCASP